MTENRIPVSLLLGGLAALALSGTAAATDALAADGGPHEVRVGPVAFHEKIRETEVALRISLFGAFAVRDRQLEGDVRLLLDLTDLENKLDRLVDTGSLPNDRCGLRVSIGRPELRPEGNVAMISIEGEAELWTCPFGLGLTRIVEQSFSARLPTRLAVDPGGRSLKVELGKADVRLHGFAGAIGASEVGESLVNSLLEGIRSKTTLDPIPRELEPYQPRILGASFFANDGHLAGSIQLRLNATSAALTGLANDLARPR